MQVYITLPPESDLPSAPLKATATSVQRAHRHSYTKSPRISELTTVATSHFPGYFREISPIRLPKGDMLSLFVLRLLFNCPHADCNTRYNHLIPISFHKDMDQLWFFISREKWTRYQITPGTRSGRFWQEDVGRRTQTTGWDLECLGSRVYELFSK